MCGGVNSPSDFNPMPAVILTMSRMLTIVEEVSQDVEEHRVVVEGTQCPLALDAFVYLDKICSHTVHKGSCLRQKWNPLHLSEKITQ